MPVLSDSAPSDACPGQLHIAFHGIRDNRDDSICIQGDIIAQCRENGMKRIDPPGAPVWRRAAFMAALCVCPLCNHRSFSRYTKPGKFTYCRAYTLLVDVSGIRPRHSPRPPGPLFSPHAQAHAGRTEIPARMAHCSIAASPAADAIARRARRASRQSPRRPHLFCRLHMSGLRHKVGHER